MEDFVTFEIAKKLKEKGFREKCLGFYTSTNSFYYNNTNICSDVSDLLECCNESEEYDDIDAPTISQVLKWLREEKKIYVDIRFNRHYQLYKYYVFTMSTDNEDMYGEYPVNTYEQAALAGIKYVLDNLI